MQPTPDRISLADLRAMKSQRRKFAMLTAYDHPNAALAQAAGVHSLLVGDSAAMVVLGHANTRAVALDYLLTIADAVRRGAPRVFLVGDMPFAAMRDGPTAVVDAALRFTADAGCDAVKFEADSGDDALVRRLAAAGVSAIAHLGLRPQQVVSPDGYRAQARDREAIERLVADARRMTDAGAAMLLLEAVPNEASQAVVDAVAVPVVGCGAGPACDGHVVVTHDMLGLGAPSPPRFVPRLARIDEAIRDALREYVRSIESGEYPAPHHAYAMSRAPETAKPGP